MKKVIDYTITENPLQMLDVKYIGPSTTKGARVIITDMRFNERITISWDYTFNTALAVALEYLRKNTSLKPFGHGLTKDHYFIVIKPVDGQFTSIKEARKERQ